MANKVRRRVPFCYAPRTTFHGSLALLSLFAVSIPAFAENLPVSLPPPAHITVDFDRDIRPIFENACFRCHGSERPKSRFRLDDRESALKGGRNNSDDIVPGHSEQSRLIRYVARLDEDMAMPPEGKGDALTPEQIALLRAWIDQGALWGIDSVLPKRSASAVLGFRWIGIRGDERKFRELQSQPSGFGGGIEQFSIVEHPSPNQSVSAEGRFLFPEQDFQLRLAWVKNDLGFVRAGFENWRRYYDDSGGYFPGFSEPQFSLNRDLYLDIGRAWIDFGLTLPDRPSIVLGYEFQYREGTKSMLEWGNVNGKNIYPAAREIHERVHVVKLDISHIVGGWRMEDQARVEFYRNQTHDEQITSFTSGPNPDGIVKTRQQLNHIQGANTLRLEKQITDWWFCSGGYLYSRLEGDSTFNQSTVSAQKVPLFGNYWNSDAITLRREMHVASVASSLQPFEDLTVSAAAQSEFSRQEGFGNISLDFGDPGVPGFFFLQPGFIHSDLDETETTQSIGLRYNGVPFTVLFADARFEQDSIGQFERETGGTPDDFLRDTDFFNWRREFRSGFNTSPLRWLAFNAQIRHRDSDSHYDHRQDESPLDGLGYSAFIRDRDISENEIETKLVLHPASWLKTTFTYRRTMADFAMTSDPVNDLFFGNVSPGGRNHSGTFAADTFGLNTSIAATRRIYFSGSFIFSDSRTETAHSAAPGVADFTGKTFSVIGSVSYELNARTRLQSSYTFSRSDFGQDNFSDGLPLGMVYDQHQLAAGVTRQITERISSNLRYSFYQFSEASSGHRNDFTAQGVFLSFILKWD
ncbi:MAG TPA: c-type cytochrome domain-containing protein [Verrucomicrobiae bacterium]|nr:c-type cytochrome domain-containing protein [Verrucomicrobiae bacterium]